MHPVPRSDFILRDNYQGAQGQVLLENLSSGADDYVWDLGNGETSREASPVVQYEESGIYVIRLTAYNQYGCPDTSLTEYALLFRGLYVPNAFVPGSDEPELRQFIPSGINLKRYSLQIMNLWGSEIWSTGKLTPEGSPAEGWDGTYRGEDVPAGTYIWKISAEFEDGEIWEGMDDGHGKKRRSGTVTLIR
ncbi:MAG: gliding motility-associated C-terminal domain-containing protein [Bacteroidales bacterium]